MSDDELTFLAAKACGHTEPGFSPLTDDGDALRLAVKLLLVVHHEFNMGEWQAEAFNMPDDDGKSQCAMYPHGTDPYAATRLAIVRAAAAISNSL